MLAALGCTAITDFSQFHVADAGGGVDLTYRPGAFGDPCDPAQPMACQPGQSAPARPLMCASQLGAHAVPGNICTRDCIIGPAACTDYPNSACGTFPGANQCVPTCSVPGSPCRSGLICCGVDGHPLTSGVGGCVPSCQ